MTTRSWPEIKICGLTDPSEALACAEMGTDAIGLVFYPKSPRNVTVEQAAAITAVLPEHTAAVGVFVDPEMEMLVHTVQQCGLSCAQLHGTESPEFIADFKEATQRAVIKGLFAKKAPKLTEADRYNVDSYLVECGQGRLPGGNAMAWDWSTAASFGHKYPMVLAGGLGPDNVQQAIRDCMPDGIDASSSLEAAPGRKDIQKVRAFIEQIRLSAPLYREMDRKIRKVLTFRS